MTKLLTKIDDVMYYPILIVVLAVAGIYFSFRTKFVQLRLFPESIRAVKEKPSEKGQVSSFQALMVSTASRVGTGNIVGVSTAIVLGGPGAAFWMWVLAIGWLLRWSSLLYRNSFKEQDTCNYIRSMLGSDIWFWI